MKTEEFKGLTYPFGRGLHLDAGQITEITSGVLWLSMPLPGSLERINLWLLEDDGAWTIVDTGMNLTQCKEVWEHVIQDVLGAKSVNRIIVTHMHPDHIGLAGWLCEKFSCELWCSQTEYLMCKNLAADKPGNVPRVALDFYRAAGVGEESIKHYVDIFGGFGRHIYSLPDNYRRLQDRETISINDRYWQVVTGHGHSPEHVCLYCPALKLLISGDQVISRISSNVSVWPTEPEGDPLADWLASCIKLTDCLPADLLVLPAHQEPFYGLHTRLSQLLEGHRKGLDRLYQLVESPKTVVECFPALFKRKIDDRILPLAVGEATAHLNWLIGRGMVTKSRDGEGIDRYQLCGDAVALED